MMVYSTHNKFSECTRSVDYTEFDSIGGDGGDVLYVFLCGGLIEPERYLPFLETLQATATDLRLWSAILRDSVCLTPEITESSPRRSTQRSREAWLPVERQFHLHGRPQVAIAEDGLKTNKHVERRLPPSSFLYPHILEPIGGDGGDVLYVFLCGAFIEPERYLSLFETLQATATDLRLWIAIVRDSVLLTPETTESSLDDALRKVEKLGFQSSGSFIFMGGHSLGGSVAGLVAYKRVHGLVLIGCSFYRDNDLVQYPVPVLTLNGERDGQVGYQSTAFDAYRAANAEAELTEDFSYFVKPVIAIPGMNHAQAFDGEDPNYERGDLIAEISAEQAHAEAASAMAAFLWVTCQGINSTSADSVRARSIMKTAVDVHREERLIFGKAVVEQGSGAEKMQVQVAAGSSLTVDKVIVMNHAYLSNFDFSRPYEIGGRTVIHVYLQKVNQSVSILYNMWVKLRNRQAVLKGSVCIGDGRVDSADAISTAREFNRDTFRTALELISREGREKYFREGLQLRFVDDLVLDRSESWDASDVVFRPSKDEPHSYECQSPVYKSDDVFYMKLITVGRAMTWIYVDAYRLHQKFFLG